MTAGVSSPTPSASRAAARSVSAIALNQIPQVAGSVLFVAVVPRMLGQQVYGQLAFAFALIAIFQMLGELGYQEIFSRFLPEARAQRGLPGIRSMVAGLLRFNFALGVGLGLGATAASIWLAPWLTSPQIWLIGLSVCLRIWAMGLFALLLGMGMTAKWSVETTWRQLIFTLLVLIVAGEQSLTLALVVMDVHEVLFLAAGLWWARRWVTYRRPASAEEVMAGPAWRTWSLLRFGLIFSMANFALVVLVRISPITVELLTGSHAEVGFFDLGLGGLLLVYTFLGQIAYAFIPIVTQLRLERRDEEARLWLGRYVQTAGLVVALGVGGIWAVARPVAPLLFGSEFAPAAESLRAISVGLLPLPVAWGAVLLTAVEKQPGRKVRAALAGLSAFLVAAVLLRSYAASGIALAFGLSLIAYAGGFGLAAWQAVRAGGVRWAVALGGTALFLPLLTLQAPSLATALGAWALATGVYLGLMLALRVVEVQVVRQMLRALRR